MMIRSNFNRLNTKIIFLGTPEFVVPIFDYCVEHNIIPAAIITQPDEPVGRKKILTAPAVKVWAETHNFPVYQPATKKELHQVLSQLAPDLCVLVAYGMIIPQATLELPKFGFINIHPSLLPKYRGPSPIQTALLNGEQETGVSLMLLDVEMDHGPILAQETLVIQPGDTNITLHQKLGLRGAFLLDSVLDSYLGGTHTAQPQNHAKATFSRIIKREDGRINWNSSARRIFDQYRAFQPWPGIFSYFRGKRLKIAKISLVEGQVEAVDAPGHVFEYADAVLVATAQGMIKVELVQLEGKSLVTAHDFSRGYTDFIGSTLE